MAPRRIAVIVLLVLLGTPPPTDARAPQDTARRLVELLQMRRPEGPGPFSAVMLVPVCSGMWKKEHVTHYREMAERLNATGYLTVHVDYVAARGLTNACGSFVPPDEIARDIVVVAKHLRSLPLVNPTRIDAIGESLGGGGVLATLTEAVRDEAPPFRRAVAFYPVCRGLSPLRAKAELLMLFGALDGMTPSDSCQPLVGQLAKPSDVQVRVYPGARHGFNLAHLPPGAPGGRPDWTPAYHPSAAKAAWEDAVSFLKR